MMVGGKVVLYFFVLKFLRGARGNFFQKVPLAHSPKTKKASEKSETGNTRGTTPLDTPIESLPT